MLENKYPIFKKGRVIKKEDFDLLRNNSLEILNLMFSNNKDGIITGFDLITDSKKRTVNITGGILKYKNKIYWMKKSSYFYMPEIEGEYIVKIKLFSEIREKKYFINRGKIIVESGNIIKENELEITRFITRTGAELRNDYKNFSDLKRDFNLLDIINVKYSSKNIHGNLNPVILRLFAEDALKKEYLDTFDINFSLHSLEGTVERESIIKYINYKLSLNITNCTNEEIYRYLSEIMESLGSDRKKAEKKKIIPSKISVV